MSSNRNSQYPYPPTYYAPQTQPPVFIPMMYIPAITEQIILIPEKKGFLLWKFDQQAPSNYHKPQEFQADIKLCNDALQKDATRKRSLLIYAVVAVLGGIGCLIKYKPISQS
jgi:hypothetical protein